MLIKHQEKSRFDLTYWIPRNFDWVHKISKTLLSKKKEQLHDYLQFIITPNTILDEIGITLIARMYDIHVGAVIKERLWATQMIADINMCDVVLAFMGKLQFSYTVPAPDISLKLDVDLSLYDDEGNDYDIPLVHMRPFQIDIHDHSQDTGSCISSLVFKGLDDFNGNLYSDSDNETIVYDLESETQPSQGDVIADKSICDKLGVDRTEDQLSDLDNSEKDLGV